MVAQSVIITGMHRSGTSLAAQIFYRSGLYLGDNLMEPGPNNPDGYFEDKDIIAFHNEIFKFNGIDRWQSPSSISARMNIPPGSVGMATELIEKKFKDRSMWGWKDPRTSWLLPFWKEILPDAKFIFTYRRPEEVVWSLIRRGDYKQFTSNRKEQILLVLKHWVKTYQEIIKFLNTYEDSGILFKIPNDLQENKKKDILVQIIYDLWELPLDDLPRQINQTYKPRLLKNKIPGSVYLISKIYLPAKRTESQIQNIDQKLLSKYSERIGIFKDYSVQKGLAKSEAVICVISPSDDLYSETFIQAHIDRLPAKVIPLYGYPLPNHTDRGEVLYSSSALKNRILKVAGHRILKLSNISRHESSIKKYLIDNQVNVVLAEYGHTGVAMMNICRDSNIPLIVHFHGHDAYRKKILCSAGKNYPELFNSAAALIVVSQDMRRQLLELGAPKCKITVNPCGVDISQFKGGDPAKAPPNFIAVGRFVDKKAPHLTILAFREVLLNQPNAKLIMLGDGPLLEACKQLAHALNISNSVEFRGPRAHAEVAEVLRYSRAFVQHSIQTTDGDSEGTPVAVIEASATGLPVVATRHAGIRDVIVDGETGLLVDEGDVHGMADAMVQLVKNPVLAARLGKQGRDRVKREYSMAKSIQILWKTIGRSLENGDLNN